MNKRISVASPVLSGNEKQYVNECLDSTWISSAGEFLTRFERRFAEYCGVRHAIATNNGTTAIHLALVAMDIGSGDEVIVPTLTYIATANAVKYCNATPVLVDCEADTYNIDVTDLERKITPKTKAIIVVHLYGHPVDMAAVNDVAGRHGIPVIEDAAEALGAEFLGTKIGSLGHCATFSFFGNKIVTTGEGGMVTTNDDELAAKLRLFRGQGMDPQRRYWFPVIGYNYRMTNVAAAIGLAQMERIEVALAKRAHIAAEYSRQLDGLSDRILLPPVREYAKHSYWMYTIAVQSGGETERDALMKYLDDHGVETRPVFYPMHDLPPYLEGRDNFPVASDVAYRGINLPTHELLSDEDIARIAEVIRSFFNGRK